MGALEQLCEPSNPQSLVRELPHAVSEERWRAELDCAPAMIVRLDEDRRITHANEAWRGFLQGRRVSVPAGGVGMPYLELARALDAAGAQAAEQLLEGFARDPRAADAREYRSYFSRALRWFKLESRPVVGGVVLVHTDITELRRARAFLDIQACVSSALAERRPLVAACRAVVELIRCRFVWDFAAIWVADQWEQLRCTDVSLDPSLAGSEFESATRQAIFERDQGLPGRVHHQQRALWLTDLGEHPNFPRLRHARAAGLQSGFGVPLVCGNQTFAVIECFSKLERPPEPEFLELLAIAGFQLGTEELRARATLRAEQAEAGARLTRSRLDALVEHAPGFILAVDPAGRIQFINRVMAHQRRDEVVGSHWLSHVPPSDHAALEAKLAEALRSGVPQRHETNIRGPDGRDLWTSAHMGPIRENGEIVGAVLSVQDITEFKRTQMEFAAAQRWASIGTLAAGVAHEINTPVQFVSDNVHFLQGATRRLFDLLGSLVPLPQLVADGAPAAVLHAAAAAAKETERSARRAFLEAEIPKAVSSCMDGLERVSTIVSSLKEFAHSATTQMEAVDLNHLIERTLAIAVNEYKYVAKLETHLEELPPVVCQVSEISQVVLNLVVNAAHAIGDAVRGKDTKGLLEVCTSRDGAEAVIEVRDTGTGIPEEIRTRIFEPFFTTKEVGKGSGQGLALAWSAIKQKHQGSLTFESTVGKGTSFFVRLPISGPGGPTDASYVEREQVH